MNKCDVHHIFPKNHLKKTGLTKGRYNQIANYAMTQSEINIAIGDQAPAVYFKHVLEQCNGSKRRYGGITKVEELRENLRMHCIPEAITEGLSGDYDAFLEARRTHMARKLKEYYFSL